MPVEYPSNVVWYLEVRRGEWPQSTPQMGSAVVVWLQRIAPPKELRKYLLTCAHVVRGTDAQGEPGFGPAMTEILCWRPGRGYVSAADAGARSSGKYPGAYSARVSSITPLAPGEVPPGERRPARDWVLLEVDDLYFQDMEAVRAWGDDPEEDEHLAILGYPGGGQSWTTGDLVENLETSDFQPQRLAAPGTLRLSGAATTGPGMSGGGVFGRTGALVGIHRSQDATQLEFGAVRGSAIRAELEARGWQVVKLSMPADAEAAPDGEKAVRVQVIASEVQHDEAGKLKWRRPLPGLTLQVKPESFNPRKNQPGVTDESGVATLVLAVAPGVPEGDLLGHLVCTAPPPRLLPVAPLITSRHAALKNGEAVSTFGRALALGGNPSVDVDVIPYAQRDRYYATEFESLLSLPEPSFLGAPDVLPRGGESDFKTTVKIFGEKLRLDGATVDLGVARWASALGTERPAPRAAESSVWEGTDLGRALQEVAPALFALRRSDGELVGTGFLIAPGTLLTASFVSREADHATHGDGAERWPIKEILWEDPGHRLAVLSFDAPGGTPLALAEKPPFLDPVGRQVVVLGYPARDPRLPPELLRALYGDAFGLLRAMPGKLLSSAEKRGSSEPERSDLLHDATTAAGVSGGPVVDLATRSVVGVHLSGAWAGARKENQAAALWDMLAEPETVERFRGWGARLAQPRAGLVASPRSQIPEQTIPYQVDFLGRCLIPLPRLATSDRSADRVRKGRVLDYVHYSLVTNEPRSMALFAACNVDRSRLVTVGRRSPTPWLLDPRAPSRVQGEPAIYADAAWERGHLIRPSAVAWGSSAEGRRAYASTFYYTNVVPQLGPFNQGLWSRLEEHVLSRLRPESPRLCLFVGPAPREDDVVVHGTRVPRLFWMLAAFANASTAGRPHVHAFLAAQYGIGADGLLTPVPLAAREVDPASHEVTVERLQQETGLVFDLPDLAE